MAFDILQARTPADSPDPLYPAPGPDPDSVMREPEDGSRLMQYGCTAALVEQRNRDVTTELARVTNIKGRITVTDSRLTFSCTEFSSGGTWRGGGTVGVLAAAAINAASKAAANRKTRGYTLVGHVRYQWLGGITAVDRHRGRSQNSLKLSFYDPTPGGRVAILTVYPPNNQPATAIGFEVARRAARWQARSKAGAEQATLDAWAKTPISTPTRDGHGRSWLIPN